MATRFHHSAVPMLLLARHCAAFRPAALGHRVRTSSARSSRSSRAPLHTSAALRAAAAAAPGADPFYVTTPIYYVNDVPHIGHAYTSIACDALARSARLQRREAYFATGTDEHGEKVQQSATKAGVTPLAFCDGVSQRFADMKGPFRLSDDAFTRTTSEAHRATAQALWKRLEDRGAIYSGTYEGWYCVRDECFYTESELVDGKAPTGAEVEWRAKEASYFFKLSEYQQPLLDYFEAHPDFIAPAARRNEVLAFVKSGLRDLSVSRTSFSWGVPVPGDKDHVMYVWVDALCNYLTALEWDGGDVDGGGGGAQFDKFWPAATHVVGKDILRFHAVYWPALLLAAGLPPPQRLFAHGWWTKDGAKISKSLGNAIEPFELVEQYGVDATRYFLLSNVQFGNDGDFSDEAMLACANGYLANALGNLVQRAASMSAKSCGGAVPAPAAFTDADAALLAAARGLAESVPAAYDRLRPDAACAAVELVVRAGNKYFDDQAPWTLRKDGDAARFDTVIYVTLEVLRCVAVASQPVMPDAAEKILETLGVAPGADARAFAAITAEAHALAPGTPLPAPVAVFPRIEVEEPAEAAAPKKKKKEKQKKAPPPLVDVPDFETAAECEAAVAEQGLEVRRLKEAGADKAAVGGAVAVLLALKAKLRGCKISSA